MGTEKKEKKKYEFNGKQYDRQEYVRLVRAEKKEKLRKYREEHGIEAPEVKSFDLNNEKVWFKNTYRQVKVQLVNGFVKRMRYFRHTLEKLNQTDTSTLEEKARNTVEAKKRRCVNGEKHKEKEMYLIKSWNSNQVFNMLIENEPIDFIKASQMTDETGDFTFRARERIRTHPLVKPVWEKINRNLNLFEEDRTEEGKSKSKKLASEVLGKATVKTETKDVAEDASGSSAVKTENVKKEKSEESEDNESEEVPVVKTEDKKEGNDSRFNMEKFKKLEEKANTEDGNEVEKMETEEIEDFNEYSSDEDDDEEGEDEDVAAEISENEDGGFDIEFVMPKFISEKPKSKNEGKKKSEEGKTKPEEEINDFFINEGEQYNQSDEEKDDEDSSSEDEEGGKNDGFFLEDDKVVKLKKNVKTETSKKKTNKDNREGQRERKKHAKAVYGKHVEVVEKQEKKFRERNKKRKGEKKVVEEKKEELHPSWAASKKAKVENKIHKFEGKKVTFDSDSE